VFNCGYHDGRLIGLTCGSGGRAGAGPSGGAGGAGDQAGSDQPGSETPLMTTGGNVSADEPGAGAGAGAAGVGTAVLMVCAPEMTDGGAPSECGVSVCMSTARRVYKMRMSRAATQQH
jgi:hypothetical protein